MEMMRGNKELLESLKNNKNMLKDEKLVLEKIINTHKNNIEINKEKIEQLKQNREKYKKTKKEVIKKALINVLEILGVGLLFAGAINFVSNSTITLLQSIKSLPTIIVSSMALFGTAVIVIESKFQLSDYKKENINIYNEDELNDNIVLSSVKIDSLSEDLNLVNTNLNKISNNIDKLENNIYQEKNVYEEVKLEEKPVQKIKM